jgi:hypothetical protein
VTRLALALVILASGTATAEPPLVGLVADGADARKAIAIGPGGEVYEPDGAGAWTRTRRIATATTITSVGRTADGVVASGGGVIYKLAPNGWSAIRLAQKGGAVMSRGPRAVGAVGKQLYALDRFKAGEPEKLGAAGSSVLAIGAGKTVVVLTDKGVFRVGGKQVTAIPGIAGARAFAGDRWALTHDAAIDLGSKKRLPWPAGAKVTATTVDNDTLHAIATHAGKLVHLELRGAGPVKQSPIDAPLSGAHAVDVVVDRAGRIVIAMSDGRILVGDRSSWTATTVADAVPAPRPGSPPATSR